MRKRMDRKLGAALLAGVVVLFSLAGCDDNDELQWGTARDAVGAIEGEQEQASAQWRDYRLAAIRSLDEMNTVLSGAREQLAVDDRSEVDDLNRRIAELRKDMVAEAEEPHAGAMSARAGLQKSFNALRVDVNTLLTRLDFDPEELAKWQDVK